MQDVELSWADKLLGQGEEKGREEGLLAGKRESLLRILTAKFGPLSKNVTERVEAMESAAELDA